MAIPHPPNHLSVQAVALRDRIREARLLLAYAAREGMDVPPETLRAVLEAETAMSNPDGAGSSSQEIHFWPAYCKLAKIVKPMTIATIEAIWGRDDALATWPNPRAGGQNRSVDTPARSVIRRYTILSLTIAIALLVVHTYWLIGDDLVNQVNNLSVRQKALTQEIGSVSLASAADDRGVQLLEAEKLEVESQRAATLRMLHTVVSPLRFVYRWIDGRVIVDSHSKAYEDPSTTTATIKIEEFTLRSVHLFLLPLLYGSMGGCVYVLRRLSREIEQRTFTFEILARLRLRLVLGTLAGLLVVWLVAWTGDVSGHAAQASVLSGLRSFPPLAGALLAGYSVDVVFAGIDRLGEALVGGPTPSRKPDTAV